MYCDHCTLIMPQHACVLCITLHMLMCMCSREQIATGCMRRVLSSLVQWAGIADAALGVPCFAYQYLLELARDQGGVESVWNVRVVRESVPSALWTIARLAFVQALLGSCNLLC